MTGEVNDTDCLLKRFNDAINDDIKQTVEEAGKAMLNTFLKINEEYKKSKKELFPIVKKYIYEYDGEVDEIEDIEQIKKGKLSITYWRTWKNEDFLVSVIVDKAKIELACQNKWDELAKQYNMNKEKF